MTKKISPELNRKAQQVPGPAKENRSTHMHFTGQFKKGEKVPLHGTRKSRSFMKDQESKWFSVSQQWC